MSENVHLPFEVIKSGRRAHAQRLCLKYQVEACLGYFIVSQVLVAQAVYLAMVFNISESILKGLHYEILTLFVSDYIRIPYSFSYFQNRL